MNCKTCRTLFLSLPDPGRPSEEVAAHLETCAACRELVERLGKIERGVAQIPVPASEGKSAFLQLFLNPAGSPRQAPSQPVLPPVPPPHIPPPSVPPPPVPAPKVFRPATPNRFGAVLRRWAPLTAAAALLIAAGLWLGNWAARTFRSSGPVAKGGPEKRIEEEKEKLPENSLAALVLECDLELAGTSDPVRRVEVLAKLGHRLRGESHWLAKAAADKELSSLSRLHARVLKDGLLSRAKILPMAERRRTLEPITLELSASHARMKTLAPRMAPAVGRQLEDIALASERTALALKELMEEATP